MDGLWREAATKDLNNKPEPAPGIRAVRALKLDRTLLATILSRAPLEFTDRALTNQSELTLPLADGTFERFRVVESPIMEPALAARFPEIKTYHGQGIDDSSMTTRFDWTPQGFHGIVLSTKGTVLIEPSASGDTENYIVYFQHDVVVSAAECDVTEQVQDAAIERLRNLNGVSPKVSSGTTLRTYRLAAAATAEYTQTYGGGTVSGGLSAITTTVNLVDAIYEREVAIRLTLIANETSIIFTDSATDGYTTDNVNSMLNENQTKLDSVIGSANYDIGHVFDGHTLSGGSFSWQGVAGIGVVCINGAKGRGVDDFRSVSPTSVFAYYSASHEMGHQFGATHTFNATTGTCGVQRSSSTAYEPVNGSTIMAYRFACAPEDLMSLDTYFHNASIEQIVNYTTAGGGNGCAVPTSTSNNPPVVDAGPVYTIPMSTPFTLTATGSDVDGDTLTFAWEEFDLGAGAPPDTDDGSRPIFRSFAPTQSPARTFPRLSDILNGSVTFGESLATTTRTMNFRVTVRDNRSGGGGVNSAATQVNVRSDSGPFTVSQPTTGTSWPTNSAQTVTWNVASTSQAPVSCTSVKILLSTDGGNSFPIVLANDTSNDGSEAVTIPGTPTSAARIKVTANGNIFFNISRGFSVTGANNSTPTISGFAPASGIVTSSVTITGTNFISPSAVSFNGVNASFTVNSTTEIVATVPAGASTGPITVTTASGVATSAGNFTVMGAVSNFQFSASNYDVSEGGDHAIVTVVRGGAIEISGSVTVDFLTSDGTATQSQDYIVNGGTLSFGPGESSKSFNVLIVDDAFIEGNETLNLTLSNPTSATLVAPSTATVTINDNDVAGSISPLSKRFFAALDGAQETPANGSTARGKGTVLLNANDTSALVGLQFQNLSSAETASHIHGNGAPGVAAPILFPLTPPITNPLINFSIAPTTQQVADLRATLHYQNVHSNNFPNGEIRGQLRWNPSLEDTFFVRQQYLDFLGRDPDTGGFNFWVGAISGCQANVQCFQTQSIGVSDAFFFEPEFQQTAGFVFRAYRASYGNVQPFPVVDSFNQTEANKLVDYSVYVKDRARVIGGADLATAQLAFANLFVSRPEFTSKYPANLDGAQFIAAILATIQTSDNVDLSGQTATLMNEFNTGGRGRVLYRLADDNAQTNPINNQAFIDAEYNRQFALTLYFGYLRHSPDIRGFLFWQDQINSAPVRNVAKQNALVCSFMTSQEYQFRFGTDAPRSNGECPP